MKVQRPSYPSPRAKEVETAQGHHHLLPGSLNTGSFPILFFFYLFIYFLDKHIITPKGNLTHGEAAAFTSTFVSIQVLRSPSPARPPEVVEPSGPPWSTRSLKGLMLGEPPSNDGRRCGAPQDRSPERRRSCGAPDGEGFEAKGLWRSPRAKPRSSEG